MPPSLFGIAAVANIGLLVYWQWRAGVTNHALLREERDYVATKGPLSDEAFKYRHWSYSPCQGWYLTDRVGGEPKATVDFCGNVKPIDAKDH